MSQHTAGPWEWVGDLFTSGVGYHQRCLNGDDGSGVLFHSAMWPIREANARLIAASPDLLEALKQAQARLFVHEGNSDLYELARIAIAKATE